MGEWADHWHGTPSEHPCEGCGAPVVVAAGGDEMLLAGAWAEGVVRFWCGDCYPQPPHPARSES